MNDYKKYFSIASTLKDEYKIPNIKAKISQSQRETKQAILKLMDHIEDEEYFIAMQTEPNNIKNERTKANTKTLFHPSNSLKTEKKPPLKIKKGNKKIISIKYTPRKFVMKDDEVLPSMLATTRRFNDSPGKSSPPKDTVIHLRLITNQCDNLINECSLVKRIITKNPDKLPVSTFYQPQKQIKQILHKKDIESLGASDRSFNMIQKHKKQQIIEQSLIIQKISNGLAYDAKKVVKKLFDIDDNAKRLSPLENTLELQKQARKTTKMIDQKLYHNISANQRCVEYLKKCNKLNYSTT